MRHHPEVTMSMDCLIHIQPHFQYKEDVTHLKLLPLETLQPLKASKNYSIALCSYDELGNEFGILTELLVGMSKYQILAGAKYFFFSRTSRLTLGPNHLPVCLHGVDRDYSVYFYLYLCGLCESYKTAVISSNSISWLVFINIYCVYCALFKHFQASQNHAMAQAVSSRPVTLGVRVPCQVNRCGICGAEIGSGRGSSK